MPTTQAVILARGLGSRMRRSDGTALAPGQLAAASTGAKGMIPLERPFLEYVVSALADAGVTEVIFVVAPGSSAIREHFSAAPLQRVEARFAIQDRPRGTAHAVLAARDAVRNAPFLVLNSDNYYTPGSLRAAAGLDGNGLVAFEADALVRDSGIEPARVLRFALLDIGADDTLLGIREKPPATDPLAAGAERWVSMNLWSFTPNIFAACEAVRPSPRGELELQDAVTIAMRQHGATFRVARRREGVLDLSHRADIATVAAKLAGVVPRL